MFVACQVVCEFLRAVGLTMRVDNPSGRVFAYPGGCCSRRLSLGRSLGSAIVTWVLVAERYKLKEFESLT